MTTSAAALDLYGICVEACPLRGDYVVDYDCDAGHPQCRWQEQQQQQQQQQPNAWHVGATTVALLGRCLPATMTQASSVTLCASPNCEAAMQPCYTEQFAAEKYWMPQPEQPHGPQQLPPGRQPAMQLVLPPARPSLRRQQRGGYEGGGDGGADGGANGGSTCC